MDNFHSDDLDNFWFEQLLVDGVPTWHMYAYADGALVAAPLEKVRRAIQQLDYYRAECGAEVKNAIQ